MACSRDQVAADLHPDFCCGFIYLTSPAVAAQLVQAGAALFPHTEVEQIEESLNIYCWEETSSMSMVDFWSSIDIDARAGCRTV